LLPGWFVMDASRFIIDQFNWITTVLSHKVVLIYRAVRSQARGKGRVSFLGKSIWGKLIVRANPKLTCALRTLATADASGSDKLNSPLALRTDMINVPIPAWNLACVIPPLLALAKMTSQGENCDPE
jgi:hypothetical protein